MASIEAGVPADLATRVASFDELFSALDIIEVATTDGHPVETAARGWFSVEGRLHARWLGDQINDLPRDNRWQTLARLALRDDLYTLVREITASALADGGVIAWFTCRGSVVDRYHDVLADIRATGTFDSTTAAVALREMGALITR
jgi:glutamate dehydrogenase